MNRLLTIVSMVAVMLAGANHADAAELWGTGSPDWGTGASGPSAVVFKFDTASGAVTTPLSFETSNWMWISGLADSGQYLYASHNTYNIDPGSSMDTHDFKIAKIDRYTGAVLSESSIAAYLGQTYSQTNALEFHDGRLYAVENATSGSTIRGYALEVVLDANGDVTGATLGAFVGPYPDAGLDYHDGLWYATSWGYTPSHNEGSIVYTSPDIMTTPFTQVGTGNSAVEGIGMIDGWEFDATGNLFAVTWYNVPASSTAVYSVNPSTWTATALYDLASQLPASIISLNGLSERVVTCPADRHVATTGDDFLGYNDCTSASTPCKTIQHAVDQACAGDTINVAAGTYDAPINIDGRSGLTINGADKTTVTIRPTTTACWGLAYGCGRKAAVRVVNSTDIALQNVTLDLDLVKANQVYGLLYWNSTGTVDNNVLENLSVSDAAGGYAEIGSYFRAPGFSDAARAHITISDNTLIDTGRVGILAHDFVDLTITGNTIYKTTNDFGYAMEIGSASTATVTGNTIYGYDTPAASDGSNSGGIYIENAFTYDVVSPLDKTVVANDNEIYGSQWALYIGNEFDGYAGDVDINLSMSGNNFHDNVDGAAVITDEDRSAGSSVTVTGSNNTLSDNGGFGYLVYTWGDGDVTVNLSGDTITGHTSTGLHVQDFASGTSGSSYNLSVALSDISGNTGDGVYVSVPDTTLTNATLTCNRIVDNGNGVVSANSGVTATQNTILGNQTSGVDASAILSGAMNATGNWWGCTSGPGNPGCDAATAGATTSPWATSAPACVKCSVATDCNDGLFCNGAESCNAQAACQAGTPPTCPSDGNVCTDDVCSAQTDACVNTPNTAPCSDGVFCDGTDTCAGGTCSAHSGNPCAAGPECANVCNEAVGNCNVSAGTACTDDGNVCTTNACNGAGSCAATNNTAPCNDGLFCDGTDTCAGGTCSQHAGNPCSAGPECANVCSETADNCNVVDGTACTDDGNVCTTNACNGSGACAATDNAVACDDGVQCTIADACSGGTCTGSGPLVGALCPWTLVVRDGSGNALLETDVQALVGGDVCASQLLLGTSSFDDGNVVATDASRPSAIRVGLGGDIAGDIVSGGGGAKGKPAAVKLPYTDVVSLRGGTVTAKNDASGYYDLSGDHALVATCTDAQASYASAAGDVAALASDLDAGAILLAAGATATVVAPHPGAVNVIDVAEVRGASGAVLELDGGGNPATAVVLRVAGNFRMRSNSAVSLIGGLTPDRVLIDVSGRKCDIGNNVQGAGTLLCPAARVMVDFDTAWTGALFAGARKLNLGDRVAVTYQPFLAF